MYLLWGTRDLPQAPFHSFKALAHLFLLDTQPLQFLAGCGYVRPRVSRLGGENHVWHQITHLTSKPFQPFGNSPAADATAMNPNRSGAV